MFDQLETLLRGEPVAEKHIIIKPHVRVQDLPSKATPRGTTPGQD
jgi:hypothetical protein